VRFRGTPPNGVQATAECLFARPRYRLGVTERLVAFDLRPDQTIGHRHSCWSLGRGYRGLPHHWRRRRAHACPARRPPFTHRSPVGGL